MAWPADGRYHLDTTRSVGTVFTFKEPGLLAGVAHDLEMSTTSLEGELTIEGDTGHVQARVHLWDLKLAPGILRAPMVMEWRRVLRKKVLRSSARAWAELDGQLQRQGEDGAEVDGTLTLLGGRAPVRLSANVTGNEGERFETAFSQEVLQTDHGIQPYRALIGGLRLKDRIRIEVRAVLVRS